MLLQDINNESIADFIFSKFFVIFVIIEIIHYLRIYGR